MAQYMKIISKYFPETEATCDGDETVYGNITFHANSKTQTELDDKWLDTYKCMKNAQIDERTRELIEQGFTFNSNNFSMSETAQRNWMAVDAFKDDLTFPFGVSTMDDGEYSLADTVEAHSFALTALGAAEAHYASGRALKQSVNAAVDEAGVDAVVDNR